MIQDDLFQPPRAWTEDEIAALRAKNRKRKEPEPRGHAARPGSGPAGETCGGCENYVRVKFSGTYRKCAGARGKWTHGRGSDIRARDPACSFWARREGEVREL